MTSTHITITGTRKGLTPEQRDALRAVMHCMPGTDHTLHHGDCVGVDAEAHNIAYFDGWLIEIHPCGIVEQRAFCNDQLHAPSTVVHTEQRPITRNQRMVNESQYVIACPGTFTDVARGSGTWATIRYAKKRGVPLTIIYPDGSIERPITIIKSRSGS